jgi:hypothetical integral membrane protein (TIGR02206 family)
VSPFQIGALAFIVVMPALVWWWDRQPHRRALVRHAERALALALFIAYACDLAFKWHQGILNPAHALPMQLCDWALLSIAPALWWRWQLGFDLAYFWALAGTLQALFTPEVGQDVTWLQQLGFFFIHAGIVTGVVHLMLTAHFRPRWPRSIVRIVIASEIYLVTALTVNALTGANYGFLSRKPSSHTMLDFFSNDHWVYVAQLNLVAFVFFALLYLPWWIADSIRGRASSEEGTTNSTN